MMKTFTFFVFVGCCLMSISGFAQTPQAIEADLLKSFKRIDYWFDKSRNDTTNYERFEDSLEKSDEEFANKIKVYTVKYPATISQSFNSLKDGGLDIFTSKDGLFRIQSWETWLGGTMRDFANVFQYNTGRGVASVYAHSNGSDDQSYTPFYTKLYTFKVNLKTYYLGVYGAIYSTKDAGTGIKIFDIEDGKLNQDVKIIKTASGLHNKLYYDYNFFSVVDIDFNKRPTIYFDEATKTLFIPLVEANGAATKSFILYKFTGKYFEKVKN